MRLVACYSLSPLLNNVEIHLIIPTSLLVTATLVFGDRLQLVDNGEADYSFTHLGLRHILPHLQAGKKYILPFFQVMKVDRKKQSVKDSVNDLAISLIAKSGCLLIPDPSTAFCYQGYMELTALPQVADVSYERFLNQAAQDRTVLGAKLSEAFPLNMATALMVFPSGSAHQVIPVEWARQNLADAVYCFHVRDEYQNTFREHGLAVETYDDVEGMLALMSKAEYVMATDSFPSHILQTYHPKAVVALTEQVRARTMHPAFNGTVIDSPMVCSPCRHKARDGNGCEMGYPLCHAWKHTTYTDAVLSALSSRFVNSV